MSRYLNLSLAALLLLVAAGVARADGAAALRAFHESVAKHLDASARVDRELEDRLWDRQYKYDADTARRLAEAARVNEAAAKSVTSVAVPAQLDPNHKAVLALARQKAAAALTLRATSYTRMQTYLKSQDLSDMDSALHAARIAKETVTDYERFVQRVAKAVNTKL